MFIGLCFIFAAAGILFMSRYRAAANERTWNESSFRSRFRLPSFAAYQRIQMFAAILLFAGGIGFLVVDVL
jgi:hypothetical protein